MKIRSAIGLLLAFMLVTGTAFGQISHGGEPASFSNPLKASVDAHLMPSINVDELRAEDALEGKDVPQRFGWPFEVDFTLTNSGTWDTLSNGDRVWRLRIASQGAYSINLLFDRFDIPRGARLFVYNTEKTHVIGSFTSQNMKVDKKFATQPVEGEQIIVEYYEPYLVRGKGEIEISTVVHAYRDLFNRHKDKGFGDSGSCNNNVHCPEAADWQDEVRSVAMIINQNGSRWCSGSMVNNVRQDLAPYFLTANHCLTGVESQWVFVFNYESPNCTNIDGPLNQTITGGTVLGNSSTSDYGLIELSVDVPESYNAYFNGWSAIDVAATSAVGIHHPAGDIKKISWENDPLASTAYLGAPGSGDTHWRVFDWDDGTTEGGSSGSPLYDQNHRVVGQLHGGYAACGNDDEDWYGKFSRSWTLGLSAILDPDNTGALTLDGRDGTGVSIAHEPLMDQLDTLNAYEVLCTITSSAAPLDMSSLYLHYDVGSGYVDEALSATGGTDEYHAFIPPQSPGTEIDYFITAADTAGEADTAGVFTFRVSDYGLSLVAVSNTGTGAVDDTIWYELTVRNEGIFSDDYNLSVSGNAWTTTIFDASGTTPISSTGTLVSGDSLMMMVSVEIPSSFFGDADTATITAASTGSAAAESLDLITTSAGEPLSLPFYETFPSSTIDIGKWVVVSGATSSTASLNPPSAPYAGQFNGSPSGSDTLMSQAIDLSGASDIALIYSYQRTGGGESPDAGDDLFIEYMNSSANWVLVNQYLGSGADMTTFEEVTYFLPPDAYHSGFRIRIRNTATSGAFDDWFVDNISIDVNFPPDISVSPLSVSENLAQGDTASQMLYVNNVGLGGLTFTAEVQAAFKSNDTFERLKAMGLVQPAYPTSYPEGMNEIEVGKGEVDPRIGFDVTKDAGGPDAFGYLWIDSDEPGGPSFSWSSIAGSGTDIVGGMIDDTALGPIQLGFAFPFYGNSYSEIWVGSNGIIGFDSTNMRSLSNVAIPTGGTPNNIIAWFWDDLNPKDPNNPGAHVYVDTSGGQCVIQFTNYPEYSAAAGDVINAQVILESDGTITIKYLSVAPGLDLTSSTIGIENDAGNDGLQVVFNSGSYLHDSLTVVFYSPYQWLTMDHGGGVLAGGGSDSLKLSFATAGLDDGTYDANVIVSSNDPDSPEIIVPVQLTVSSGPQYVCGDINNNGEGPDLSDLIYLVNYLFLGGPAPQVLAACNVNGSVDTNPDLSDLIYLVNYLFNGGPAPNCP
ncbi:trypsin-like peptidase domain-containing protein [bacterium]|nr:trypsin-like peptidase domain-containing protein [bacterium]